MTEWNDKQAKRRKNVQVFTRCKNDDTLFIFLVPPFLFFEGQFPCLFCTIRTHTKYIQAHTHKHTHTHIVHTHTHQQQQQHMRSHTRSFYSQFPFSLSSFFSPVALQNCLFFFTPFLFLWESFHCIVCCSLPLS